MQRFASTLLRRRGSLVAALCIAARLFAPAAHAQNGDIAGSYEASPQRMTVKVQTWGEDCGTRPIDQVINEPGKVTVRSEGAHLSLKFGTRTVRTNSCWSQNQSLTLVSATSANGIYRAECRTSAGDAKREIGRYTVSTGPGTLELLEESEYDWQLKASHCVAKVRITQTLTSLSRKPSAEAKDAGLARATVAAAEPEEKCVPGPAARLRMRPSEARIAPGERVCFVVRVVDTAGCPLALGQSDMELSVQRPNGVQGALSGSCFKAADNAALAEGLFKIQATSGALRAEASVLVAAPDLSDITARRGASGSSASNSSGGGRSAVTQYETGVRAVSKGPRDLVWLGVTIAALAAVLAAAALIALRAARKPQRVKRPRARSSFPEEGRASAVPAHDEPVVRTAHQPAEQRAVPSGPQRICPRCRRGYPPGTERCSDGEVLLDYDAFVAGASAKAAARFCPECGEAMGPDAFFCGACGHKMTVR